MGTLRVPLQFSKWQNLKRRPACNDRRGDIDVGRLLKILYDISPKKARQNGR